MKTETPTKLYRYDRSYLTDYYKTIVLREFHIVETTPKGYWILNYSIRKWVSNSARKRFAYPTPDEAYENFRLRTERCILILKARLNEAQSYLVADRPERSEAYYLQ